MMLCFGRTWVDVESRGCQKLISSNNQSLNIHSYSYSSSFCCILESTSSFTISTTFGYLIQDSRFSQATSRPTYSLGQSVGLTRLDQTPSSIILGGATSSCSGKMCSHWRASRSTRIRFRCGGQCVVTGALRRSGCFLLLVTVTCSEIFGLWLLCHAKIKK